MQSGAAGDRTSDDPARFCEHVLKRSGSSLIINDAWPVWMEAAGIRDVTTESWITFEFLFAALEAPKQGSRCRYRETSLRR